LHQHSLISVSMSMNFTANIEPNIEQISSNAMN
jgi:hypothetical protein